MAYWKKAAILIALFLAGAFLFSSLDSYIVSVISPIWRAENRVSRTFAKGIEFFSFRQTLIDENTALKEKLASLEIKLSALEIESPGARESEDGILAAVLTHPPQSPYDIIIVDAGSRDSVSAESLVSLPEGPQLGRVSEVSLNASRVRLFSSSGEKTNAVLERHNVPVVIEGVGAGNFHIIVPRDTEVQIGDRVLSAHLKPSLLAVIEDIEIEATDSFKKLFAKSPANIFAVRLVKIEQ